MIAHYRFRHVARMEWIKLRTLRSVRWTLLFALAGMIGIGIAAGFNDFITGRRDAGDRAIAADGTAGCW